MRRHIQKRSHRTFLGGRTIRRRTSRHGRGTCPRPLRVLKNAANANAGEKPRSSIGRSEHDRWNVLRGTGCHSLDGRCGIVVRSRPFGGIQLFGKSGDRNFIDLLNQAKSGRFKQMIHSRGITIAGRNKVFLRTWMKRCRRSYGSRSKYATIQSLAGHR